MQQQRIFPVEPAQPVVLAQHGGQHLRGAFMPRPIRKDDRLRHLIHQVGAHVFNCGLDHRGHGARLILILQRHVQPMLSAVNALAAIQPLPFSSICVAVLIKKGINPFYGFLLLHIHFWSPP